MKKLVIVLGIFLILGAAAFFVLGKGSSESEAVAATDPTDVVEQPEDDAPPPVPVELASVSARDIPSYFNATGTLAAKRLVAINSKVQGEVNRILVEEGDFVRKGQTLLELDHREQKLLAQKARVMAETAQLEFERRQEMNERGLGTDRELEEARQTAEVNSYEHDLANVKLQDHIVRAPFDGQVTLRNIEVGQTVAMGESLVELSDVSPLEILLYLPEKIVTRLQLDQPVAVYSDVQPDAVITGVVERIAPVVDSATSTVKVTLRVDDAPASARVGTFVRARITTDVHRATPSIPKRALVAEAGANFVFVAAADSVSKVEVTTGYADDAHIEILSGVSLEDRVVTIGQGGLRDGSRVRDLNAPEIESDTAADDTSQVSTVASNSTELGG